MLIYIFWLLPVLILVFWSMKFCRRQIFIVGGKISTCRHILTGLWNSVVIGLRIKILAHNNKSVCMGGLVLDRVKSIKYYKSLTPWSQWVN